MKMSSVSSRGREDARNLWPVLQRVLGRRRVVIDATGVDLGAAIKQESRDFRAFRVMQRPLTVATFFMDDVGVGLDELAKFAEPAEAGGGVGG